MLDHQRIVAPGVLKGVREDRQSVERRVRVDAASQRNHVRGESVPTKRREWFGPRRDLLLNEPDEQRADSARTRIDGVISRSENMEFRTTDPSRVVVECVFPPNSNSYINIPRVVPRGMRHYVGAQLYPNPFNGGVVNHLVVEREELTTRPQLACVRFGASLGLAHSDELHRAPQCPSPLPLGLAPAVARGAKPTCRCCAARSVRFSLNCSIAQSHSHLLVSM